MKATLRRDLIFCAVPLLLTGFAAGQTFTIDFENDDTGTPMVAGSTDLRTFQPYDDLFGPSSGVLLFTNNPSPMPLNLYDSEGLTNQDDDLERNSDPGNPGNWAGGTETNTIFNNLLIVNRDTVITNPNDNGSGGQFILRFDVALTEFSFDFVDMDAGDRADIIFTDRQTLNSHTIPFTEFEAGSGSQHEVPGALFGNRHANSINGITAAELPGLSEFDEVTFDMRSSGGIGTVTFTLVPEPSLLSLLALAGAGLSGRRRRG